VDPPAPAAADIHRAACALLARREHSYAELRSKLSRRFVTEALIEQQLDRLVAADLQSDRRFCETYVRSKYQQGQGPQRISQALKQRGIDAALIQEMLWDADIDWYQRLQQLYHRRYGELPMTGVKERERRIRFLQYRGFHFDLIHRLLAEAEPE
jgi:regulatory protein